MKQEEPEVAKYESLLDRRNRGTKDLYETYKQRSISTISKLTPSQTTYQSPVNGNTFKRNVS